MWPAAKPRVAPEKRPSVISATSSPNPCPADRGRHAEHLAHAGAALRPLVADDDDVAGHDLAAGDGRGGVLLALEDARGAAVASPCGCR